MNHVSMKCHQKNMADMGSKWVYNEVSPCDTNIMINKRVANRMMRMRDARSKQHTRAILYEDRQDKCLIVNMHLPTAWQTAREYKGASHEASEAIQELKGENQCCTIILAGDLNAELWKNIDCWLQKNDEVRAQHMWGGRAEWNLGPHPEEESRRDDNQGWAYVLPQRSQAPHRLHLNEHQVEYFGVAAAWHCLSDHRPMVAVLPRRDGELISFAPSRASCILRWRPTCAVAARLARRWAEWCPGSMAEVQDALVSAATVQASVAGGGVAPRQGAPR